MAIHLWGLSILMLLCSRLGTAQEEPECGLDAGKVVGPGGQPVVGALVILCDGATGIPVDRTTWEPFTRDRTMVEEASQRLGSATTSDAGTFEIDGVAPGSYRVVAQTSEAAVMAYLRLQASHGAKKR